MAQQEPVYKRTEDEATAVKVQRPANPQMQQVYKPTEAVRRRLGELKPVVTDAVAQQRVIAQQIVTETFRSLEKGIPKDYSLRTLLG